MKFLIDECLSPELAIIARARGFQEGFIFVTNNAVDFTALYERQEIHAGLVCLNIAPNLMGLEIKAPLS